MGANEQAYLSPVVLYMCPSTNKESLLLALADLCVVGLMADLGMPLNDEQLQLAIKQLDGQQTGTVSFGQFLLWWRE